jgi:cobalt/nickel transport system ATP-binding protein
MTPAKATERALIALEQVGMTAAAGKAPYHLSAGQKKRVAIAGILAVDPEILVLDEPTTFLDPPGQRALAHLLAGLPQAKILITHDIPFARATCTRAVFFRKGLIEQEGTVDEIAANQNWEFRPRRAE